MPMKNPPHPGQSIKMDCLDPIGLSVTGGAKVLGVTRQALSTLAPPVTDRPRGSKQSILIDWPG